MLVLPVTPRESVPAAHSVHTLLPALSPAALKVLAGQAVCRHAHDRQQTDDPSGRWAPCTEGFSRDDAPVHVSPVPMLKLPGAHGMQAALLVLPMAPAVSFPGAHGVRVAVPVLLAYVLTGHTVRQTVIARSR